MACQGNPPTDYQVIYRDCINQLVPVLGNNTVFIRVQGQLVDAKDYCRAVAKVHTQ